jgi:hypothetical protein
MGVARLYHTAHVHYLRKDFTFADDGLELKVGTIPAGSLIIKPMSGVFVSTVFNAGTTNVLDIGTNSPVDNDDILATDLALGTLAFVPLDEAVGDFYCAAETDITATVDLTGSAASTGRGHVVIAYIPSGL